MSESKSMFSCDLCSANFQMGPHLYEGKIIPTYGVQVCNTCYQVNWDGWAPHFESKIIEIAKSKDLPIPNRNDDGWLPRD
ncbi:hypothetical protein GCM10009347_43070 [Shewanella algicola]|uniref:Uncharacterized protein n=1 Tax=Shewanella algicola TaxID=640633 RepID=A0A9X2CBN2_9GAMM|nr:hypothetical protein [Shewanella algicola]MCL1107890.1 hypothetical protein [Shewanella algicola]GGP74495.1 hypothetical protein GCM10009347_43070 [Shewanella algicola]